MKKGALMVIDTQVNMFDDSFSVYDGDRILKVIDGLIERARNSEVDVIFIRNNGHLGEPDEPGLPGWHIHPAISPQETDLIIDKEGSDAFTGTDLQVELDNRKIDQIFLVGMQTEMCVAATVREAAKRGYAVTLIEDGHTTFDWDEITAVDAIEKYNKDLAQFAVIQKAQDVVFR